MHPEHPPELIRSALDAIPPTLPRDEWARLAMAIKSEYPDGPGFELFDAWSQNDAAGYDAKATAATWRSVKPGGGVGLGTLFFIAQQHGWKMPEHARPAPPDAAELARREAERRERDRAERQRVQAAQEAAADEAGELWHQASEAGAAAHPYLQRKGVGAHGVRLAPDGWLLVPLRDAAGELRNLQRIAPAKPSSGPDKLFLRGGQVSGLLHLIGAPAGDVALLAEGYATGASLHAATGLPVAVGFNAGNLKAAARVLRQIMGPGALIVVCGDDDRATELQRGKNPGREAAQAAAALVHGLAVLPRGLSAGQTDFNDLHQHAGLDAVRNQVQAAIDAHRRHTQPTPTDNPAAAPADADAHDAPAAPGGKAGKRTRRKPHAPDAPAAAGDDGARRDPFIVDSTGVYHVGRDREGNDLAPQWLCGPLHVTARTRDSDGHAWGYLLSFSDPNGRPREWAMPARMLAADGGELRAALLGMGLSISTQSSARNRLSEYLQTREPDALAVATERAGWHPTPEGGAVFVQPHETIGESAERVIFQSEGATENTIRQRGDVSAWRDRVGALCVGNSRLVFAAACAFAGPLVRPAGVDSGGFHYRGESSSGKTTALRVAASIHGGPSYMQRWRTTDNALELIAAQHCDSLLILDELAQVDGRVAGECAYMLANESSKGRASRGAALRARLSWRLLFLSAGELGLSDHMAEAMKRARAGQEVRMVDVIADAGCNMGMFEDLHGRDGPAAFATELQRATAGTHGASGRAWLQWLAPQWQGLGKLLRERMEAMRAAWVPAGASGQVERVAARFAIVATAGELATEAGLTGWPAGESERAARKCFESWLAARGGAGNAEVRQMLQQVRRFIELNGEGRFTWWHRAADDHNVKTLNRAGFRRLLMPDGTPIARNSQHAIEVGDVMPSALGEETQTEYFILPETFKSEVCQGFDPAAVCRVLLEHGALVVGDRGHFDKRMRLPGVGNARCYHITPALMDAEP